ncbi:MAG: hypothetical protein ACFBZ8_13790 [Opitutales bacterium]
MEGIRFGKLFERRADPLGADAPQGMSWRQRWRWALAGFGGICGMLSVGLLAGGLLASPAVATDEATVELRAELSERLMLAATEARSGLWEAYTLGPSENVHERLATIAQSLATVRGAAGELARPLPAEVQATGLGLVFQGVGTLERVQRELQQAWRTGQPAAAYGAVAVRGSEGLRQILAGGRALEAGWRTHLAGASDTQSAASGYWWGLGLLLLVSGLSAGLLFWLGRQAEQTFGGIGESLSYRAGLLEDIGRTVGLEAQPDPLEVEVVEEGKIDGPSYTWDQVRERCQQNVWQGRVALQKSLDLQRMLQREITDLQAKDFGFAAAVAPMGTLRVLPRELERLTYAANLAAMEASAEAAQWERHGTVDTLEPGSAGDRAGTAVAEASAALREATRLQMTANELQRLADAGTSALRAWKREGETALEQGSALTAERKKLEANWQVLQQLAVELHDLLRQVDATNQGQDDVLHALESALRATRAHQQSAERYKRFAEEVRALKTSAGLLLKHTHAQVE